MTNISLEGKIGRLEALKTIIIYLITTKRLAILLACDAILVWITSLMPSSIRFTYFWLPELQWNHLLVFYLLIFWAQFIGIVGVVWARNQRHKVYDSTMNVHLSEHMVSIVLCLDGVDILMRSEWQNIKAISTSKQLIVIHFADSNAITLYPSLFISQDQRHEFLSLLHYRAAEFAIPVKAL